MKFWMFDWMSTENTATFLANICFTCQRAFDPSLVPEAKPICLVPTYQWEYILRHWNEDTPIEYDLPTWDPLACSVKLDK